MECYVALVTALILVACAESSLHPWRVSSRSHFHRGRAVPLCPSYPLPAASPTDLLAKLKPFLEEAAKNISAVLEEDKSPGGAVVNVVYNDTVIWTKGFGLVNDSDPSRGAPDGDTAFRIGSITKVFTALMMLMSRDGTLEGNQLPSLDEDIAKYLPELKIQNPFQTKRGITFNQLSSHMAGLPRETPCPNMFLQGCNLSYDKIYDNLAEMELEFPPGQEPQYSNLGFAILGRTLEKFLGTSWEEALPKAILQPLGMKNSGNKFTPESIEHLAVGYSHLGTVAKLIDIGFEAPAGQMYSTTNDLAQLMKLLFRPEKPYNFASGQILDGETIREWMQPAYKYHDGTGFGHPWELIPLGNYTLRTKSGGVPGYNTEFGMAHEIKTGFIFLQSCNGCTSHAPILEISWQIILKVSQILSTMQPPPRVPPNPTDYTGSYAAEIEPDTQMTLKIVLEEVASGHAALLAEILPLPYKIIVEWVEGDKFQLSAQGMTLPCAYLGDGLVGEIVHFQKGPNGVVDSATIPGLTYGTVFIKIVLGEVTSGHAALLVEESPLPYKVILEWVEVDKFQLSAQGVTLPCSYLGAGDLGERVYFQRGTNGVVTSATIPGLTYGTVFMKV